jgi:hypothetical protein
MPRVDAALCSLDAIMMNVGNKYTADKLKIINMHRYVYDWPVEICD